MCMNTHIDPLGGWEEIRTAYHVARLGTLSAAAAYLGMHHATAIRHIDALEARLGCKLFQRHPRGYQMTEAGEDMLHVATAVEDRFAQMAGRLRGQSFDLSGELTVTMLNALSPSLTPVLAGFQSLHPEVRLNVIMDERLLRLDTGEAHVALRAGPKPQEPDNVVRSAGAFAVALFASPDYVARAGRLGGPDDYPNHRFVGMMGARVPTSRWMSAHVPAANVTYKTTDLLNYAQAVRAGLGIGFLPMFEAAGDPALVQMAEPDPDMVMPLWLVTHRDLNRMARVQALTGYLQQAIAEFPESAGIILPDDKK